MNRGKRLFALLLTALLAVSAPLTAAAEMLSIESPAPAPHIYKGWDENNVASPDGEAQSVPHTKSNATEFASGSGTANDPYIIKTKEHLNNVRNYLSAHFRMDADIIFSPSDFAQGGEYYHNGTGWQPIGGTLFDGFSGFFDGNNHTVTGLQIDQAYAGLFMVVWGGTVQNLKLASINISVGENVEYAHVGGIAASVENAGIIENCYVSGSISAVSVETCTAGGIVGHLDGTVQNCCNNAYIQCESSSSFVYAGGIAGEAVRETSNISNCQNTQSVTGMGYSETHVGGIVGLVGGMVSDDTDAVLTITQCYNTATVSATTQHDSVASAGGIAGCLATDALISDCYNAGDIYTNEINSSYLFNYRCTGGIVGWISDYHENHLTRCYNVGKITDLPNITSSMIGGTGGIIGKTSGKGVTVASCYYMDNTAKGVGNGSISGTTVRCTENKMLQKSTYAGFDFGKVWTMGGTEDYPYPELSVFTRTYITGDSNGDGNIDGRDVISICNYIANYDYDTNTSSVDLGYGADANGDGNINGKDVIILCNYIANYDYETGSSTVILGGNKQ